MIAYVQNVVQACRSIFDGMAVTFSHLLRPPVTVQYPDRTERPVKETLPDRYRGHLTVELDICISCGACERACPIECIRIEDVRIPKETVVGVSGKKTPRAKEPVRFDINLYKCMYCGLCTEACPTRAIYFTKEFEGTTDRLENLHLRFVSPERLEMALAKAKEQEKAAAEAAKAKAEEKKSDEEKPTGCPSADFGNWPH